MKNLQKTCIFAIVASLAFAALGEEMNSNDSNIYRISRNRSATQPARLEAGEMPKMESAATDLSRGNPELDWQSTLNKQTNKDKEVKKHDIDFMIDKLEKTPNLIQWLTDLYSPLRWKKIPGEPNEMCKNEMEHYLKELRNGASWASKSKYEMKL